MMKLISGLGFSKILFVKISAILSNKSCQILTWILECVSNCFTMDQILMQGADFNASLHLYSITIGLAQDIVSLLGYMIMYT